MNLSHIGTNAVVQSPILLVLKDSRVTRRASGCQIRQQHKERVWMPDEKATNSDVIRLRRTLAAFYPQTHSRTPLPAITAAISDVQPRERDNSTIRALPKM